MLDDLELEIYRLVTSLVLLKAAECAPQVNDTGPGRGFADEICWCSMRSGQCAPHQQVKRAVRGLTAKLERWFTELLGKNVRFVLRSQHCAIL